MLIEDFKSKREPGKPAELGIFLTYFLLPFSGLRMAYEDYFHHEISFGLMFLIAIPCAILAGILHSATRGKSWKPKLIIMALLLLSMIILNLSVK